MKRALSLVLAICALLFAASAGAQNWTVIKGEDEDGFKRVIKSDTKGRVQGVQGQNLLDACDVVTGWAALSNDTTGIDVDLDHVEGTKSLEFDKVDGTDNKVYAGVEKTLTPAIDVASYMENNGWILLSLNVSATTDIAYCFVRLGTDASNYNEWRVDDDALSAGWQQVRFPFFAPSTAGNLGNGISATSVSYAALGCYFDLETSTLADVRVDNLVINTGFQTSVDLQSQVATATATPNVNVVKMASQPVDMNSGTSGVGTQRVTQSTDDIVSVSDDDNPNTATNPLYCQPTDGTGVNAQGKPIYVVVSKDTAVNALGNPIMVQLSDGTNAFLTTTAYPGYWRLQDGAGTNLAYVAPATADDLSKSENGLKVEAVAKYDDGTALDTGKIGATGEILVGGVYTRPGENPSLGAREIKVTYLGTTEPVKVGPTAVDDTALSVTTGTVILGPTKVLANGRLCVYVKNTGGGSGDDLSDVEIYDSPDGTSGWDDANTWTSCDGLAAGTKLCKKCVDDAWPWIQIKGRCAATEDTEAEVFLRQVKR